MSFLSAIVRWFFTYWVYLTQPTAPELNPDEARQSRLMASLVIIVIAVGILGYVLPILLGIYQIYTEFFFLLIALAVLVYAYRLSIKGYFRTAAVILTFNITVILYIVTLLNTYRGVEHIYYYLIFPMLISAIFLAGRWMAIQLIINTILMIVVAEVHPTMVQADAPISFYIMSSLSLMAYRYHQQALEQDRQRELAGSEERYRTLFESISDAIAVNEDGIHVDINSTFEKRFGYSRAEVIGVPVANFIAETHKQMILNRLDQQIVSPQELAMIHKDGHIIPIEVASRIYHYRGRERRITSIRDISERKESEAQRFALELEKHKVQLMMRFISDASHDLRTPLTVIKSSLHLLRLSKTTPESKEKRLNMIEAQTSHLQTLIENLLTVNRLERASEDRLEKALFDLNLLAQEIVDEQASLSELKQVTLSTSLEISPISVKIDPDEMRRALRQLVSNALHYTPRGGMVTVRTRSEPGEVVFEVQDTGIGINPKDVTHIFEMFYRADPARSTDKGGMGLGLSITKRIVEAHGGYIEVQSQPNEGSTFTVRLPIETAPVMVSAFKQSH